jgi:hypothetical protein
MSDVERPKYLDNWTWFAIGIFLIINGIIWLTERNIYSNIFKMIIILGVLSFFTGIKGIFKTFLHNKSNSLEIEEKKPINETTNNTIRSAHLDFYSTAAMTYAQVFIACIFGLFATLTIMDQTNSLIILLFSSITFWGLYIGGAYCLMNYAHFWRTAFIVKRKMIEYDYEQEQENGAIQKGNPIGRFFWSVFYKIKNKFVLYCAIIVYLLILLVWFALLID